MPIIISGKDFKLTAGLKQYVTKEMHKAKKFAPTKPTEMRVELDVDKNQRSGSINRVEMSMHLPGKEIKAGKKSEHMREAIDLCTAKLIRQIKKYKDKRIQRRQNHTTIRIK